MAQAFQDPKRYRGFVLTSIGLQKLQQGIQALEQQTGVRQGARAIAERVQLIVPDGIHPMTVRKLLRGQQGVDKRSIEQVFTALQLTLEVGDYAHASLSSSKLVALTEHPTIVSVHSAIEQEIEALIETNVYGRKEERSRLRFKLLVEQCRLLAVLGATGIGKTTLVKKLIVEVEPAFERFVWKSLHPASPLIETLTDLLQALLEQSKRDVTLPTTVEGLISCLMRQLQQHRCLLVLDGVESLLGNRLLAGYYREGYEQYGEIFRVIAETFHSSCLILTSQEKPRGFKRLENPFVHAIRLQGLTVAASQQLLQSQGIFAQRVGDWHRIVDYYAGNPLLLKLAAAQIVDYFDDNISAYLSEVSHKQCLFQDIRDVLEQQFSRATQREQRVIMQLAIAGDWVTLSALQTELNTIMSRQELLDVLDSLSRRSLFQKNGAAFRLSTAMTEFMQHYKSQPIET